MGIYCYKLSMITFFKCFSVTYRKTTDTQWIKKSHASQKHPSGYYQDLKKYKTSTFCFLFNAPVFIFEVFLINEI